VSGVLDETDPGAVATIIGDVAITAVFFDAGETLVHPHPTFPDLFASVLRREGVTVDPGAIGDRIIVVSDRFAKAARDQELWTTTPQRSKTFWLSVYEIFLREIGVPHRDGLEEKLYEAFTDLANYALFDDVAPVLEELHARGLTLGVISNFEEWLERLLDALDVTRFFQVRVISGVEGMEKPDPRIFRTALDRAGVRPDHAVYVGDSPVFDVEPAAQVGMLPILIDRRGRYPDATSGRITSMRELPEMLRVAAEAR
jgi:putative hydrolase of the HAD superfamily